MRLPAEGPRGDRVNVVDHLNVGKIEFKRSIATRKEIMKMAAIIIKDISIETGRKSL